jgi:hypothetical protein
MTRVANFANDQRVERAFQQFRRLSRHNDAATRKTQYEISPNVLVSQIAAQLLPSVGASVKSHGSWPGILNSR